MRQLAANEKIRGFLGIVLIIAITYPVINLLRTTTSMQVPKNTYIKEILFFIISLFILNQLQLVICKKLAKVQLLQRRILMWMIIGIVITALLVPLVAFPIYLSLFPKYLRENSDLRTMFFFTLILLLIQCCLLFYYHFKVYLRRFEQGVITQEKLRYEKMLAQYKALQNQVSPHFLFNCLNDLNAVIEKKPTLATDIVLVLSDTLKYIIANEDKLMVDLRTEIEFLNNYLFLQLLRCPACIQVSYSIDKSCEHRLVPPTTLQILVENAIKHNNFSPDKKLTIAIRTLSDNALEITNSVSELKVRDMNKCTGTGLKNVHERYSLLTDQHITIRKNENYFTVIIPLIEN